MSKPIKVLQVLNSLGRGGIESLVCDIYQNIDRDQVQFDFCVAKGKNLDHIDEVKKLGAEVYIYPNLTIKNFIPYLKWWNKFFKEHNEYKIVHAHVFTHASLILKIAKKNGLTTIVHSHGSGSKEYNRGFINKIIRYYLLCPLKKSRFIDYRLACSESAGKYIFKNSDFRIINNGIQIKKFIYNETVRNQYRTELSIQNNFVIGNVGNAVIPKNHIFLLEIFTEIIKKEPSSKLVLVGRGIYDNPEIVKAIDNNDLRDHIIYLGVRDDVQNLLQAMDVFVHPALYEGLGIVVIEAQTAGLKTVCSDGVPPETNISDLIEYIGLDRSAEYWADEILKYKNGYERTDRSNDITDAGYNIKKVAEDIRNLYLKIYNNEV